MTDRLNRFYALDKKVMLGPECVCEARSRTMAKRIANALNEYLPNQKGY